MTVDTCLVRQIPAIEGLMGAVELHQLLHGAECSGAHAGVVPIYVRFLPVTVKAAGNKYLHAVFVRCLKECPQGIPAGEVRLGIDICPKIALLNSRKTALLRICLLHETAAKQHYVLHLEGGHLCNLLLPLRCVEMLTDRIPILPFHPAVMLELEPSTLNRLQHSFSS